MENLILFLIVLTIITITIIILRYTSNRLFLLPVGCLLINSGLGAHSLTELCHYAKLRFKCHFFLIYDFYVLLFVFLLYVQAFFFFLAKPKLQSNYMELRLLSNPLHFTLFFIFWSAFLLILFCQKLC